MSVLPLGLFLNLDVMLSLNHSVRKQASYCLRNPTMKDKWRKAQLILAVLPSASQPEMP